MTGAVDHRTLPVPDGLAGERVDAAMAQMFGLSVASVRGTRDPSRRIPRKANTRMSAAATLMHMSATLKIGQWGSIRKSIT